MSGRRLDELVLKAIEEAILPASASVPPQDSRPWPVVLLTGLGAWLAALPLLGAVGLMLGDLISRGVGPYLVGLLVLAGAIVVLRSRELPLFVEQLAVPALLVGGGSLGFGLFRDLPSQPAAALLALIALGFAWAIPRPWLRVLLGAAAAVLTVIVCLPERFNDGHLFRFGVAWHGCFALWLVAGWVQRQVLNDGARAGDAAALESVSAGWLLATLAGLAWWSGMSFLVGASLGGGLVGVVAGELGARSIGWGAAALKLLSLLLSAGGALWLARVWPSLRKPWCGGVAVVLVALAWFMPALGAVLVALAVTGASRRWQLTGAAALAAAWILGSFYYQLHWPLATKAVVLVVAAAALGALAWLAPRTPATSDSPRRAETLSRIRQAGIVITALAVLAVANTAIWQKQNLIANGQPVYLELAPVDPRSLMQGDFMRLNFRLPSQVRSQLEGLLSAQRPRVVVQLDERGVARVLRLDADEALAADELRVELTPKNGRWIFVSDAWFFREGEAERWAPARFGEFRVAEDGRALLVGMVGPDLEPL